MSTPERPARRQGWDPKIWAPVVGVLITAISGVLIAWLTAHKDDPSPSPKHATNDPPPPSSFVVQGYVKNARTGDPVPGAALAIDFQGPTAYYATDPNGHYTFTLASKETNVEIHRTITATGYRTLDGAVSVRPGWQPDVRLLATSPTGTGTGSGVTVSPPPLRLSGLPAPETIVPRNGTAFNTLPRHTVLRWSVVPGAASYCVEVQRQSGTDWASVDSHSGITGTGYAFDFPAAQGGRWRVWAVGADGRPGAQSSWSFFSYYK